MPAVLTFAPAAIVGKDGNGNDILGLNKTNNSLSTTLMTGTGFASQDAVNVTCGEISWTGNLNVESSERGSVSLTCNNPPGPGRLGEPESVSVTVGSGISAAAVFKVNVGTPPP